MVAWQDLMFYWRVVLCSLVSVVVRRLRLPLPHIISLGSLSLELLYTAVAVYLLQLHFYEFKGVGFGLVLIKADTLFESLYLL